MPSVETQEQLMFFQLIDVLAILTPPIIILRLTIGTWSIVGRILPKDLEIGEWLCMKELVGVYILG